MMPSSNGAPTVAVLTNIVAPYRVPIYQRMAARFAVEVLLSGSETNRAHWDQTGAATAGIRFKSSWGFTLSMARRQDGAVHGTRYVHLNPGLFFDLIRLNPDAVISDEMGFRSLAAWAYARLRGIPLWVWWGGTLHTERHIGRARQVIRRFLVERIDRWLSYGSTSTEYLVSLGVPASRITELQNCVPEQAYLADAGTAARHEPRPVVLCVGQLIRRKGIELLLRSAARVQGGGAEFTLLLVGDGPERAAIEQMVQELGLRHVRFAGSQTPDRMPAIYRSADVLVFPTLEDVWGLVVNEALWSGLPALVSVYAGCAADLVPPESTFDPLDPRDFDQKLRTAIAGALPAPDRERLMTVAEVSDLIVADVERTLGAAV